MLVYNHQDGCCDGGNCKKASPTGRFVFVANRITLEAKHTAQTKRHVNREKKTDVELVCAGLSSA